MKTDVVVHSAALTNGSVKRTLSEGSSVYVRIIKKDGNNSYTAAFGGGRFSIKSELPLKPGMGFFTTIRLENNRIVLQQQNVKMIVQDAGLQKINSALDMTGKISDPQLICYFEKMGLTPDEITLSVYNQMRNLEVRFERSAFIKARAIGMKFRGREKAAAVTAYILEQKGIVPSEDAVSEILGGNENMSSGFGETSSFGQKDSNPAREFFKKIFECTDFSDSKAGLLAVFNHTGFKTGGIQAKSNWIKIPFTYTISDDEEKSGEGSFCAFLNPIEKNAEKFTLLLKFCNHSYGFAVFLKKNVCSRIIISPTEEYELDMAIKDELLEKYPDAEIAFCQPGEFNEFYGGYSEIGFVNGVV